MTNSFSKVLQVSLNIYAKYSIQRYTKDYRVSTVVSIYFIREVDARILKKMHIYIIGIYDEQSYKPMADSIMNLNWLVKESFEIPRKLNSLNISPKEIEYIMLFSRRFFYILFRESIFKVGTMLL